LGVERRRGAVQVRGRVAAPDGGGLWALGGLDERAGAVSSSSAGGQVGDLAGVAFKASSMASTAWGMAAAMAWATRLGLAWATLPPMEAAVPQMTRSQP